jgi:hypothetical protein
VICQLAHSIEMGTAPGPWHHGLSSPYGWYARNARQLAPATE